MLTSPLHTCRSAQLGVVDQLNNLGELDLRSNAVQAGHSLQELIRAELSSRVLRFPYVEVRSSVLLLAESEELVAQYRDSFEHSSRLRCVLAISLFIEVVLYDS